MKQSKYCIGHIIYLWPETASLTFCIMDLCSPSVPVPVPVPDAPCPCPCLPIPPAPAHEHPVISNLHGKSWITPAKRGLLNRYSYISVQQMQASHFQQLNCAHNQALGVCLLWTRGAFCGHEEPGLGGNCKTGMFDVATPHV